MTSHGARRPALLHPSSSPRTAQPVPWRRSPESALLQGPGSPRPVSAESDTGPEAGGGRDGIQKEESASAQRSGEDLGGAPQQGGGSILHLTRRSRGCRAQPQGLLLEVWG